MTGTLDSQELGSYVTVVGILQRHAGKNGGVLYHADGSRISVNVLPMVDCPSWHWYVHALVPEVVTDVPIAASPWTAEIGYTPTVSQTRMLRELKGTTVLASPCGTGKRVMLAWHVRDAGFTTVVVAAPLIASAEQALPCIAPFLPGHTAVDPKSERALIYFIYTIYIIPMSDAKIINDLFKTIDTLKTCVTKNCGPEKAKYWSIKNYDARKKYGIVYKAAVERHCKPSIKKVNTLMVLIAKKAASAASPSKKEKAKRDLVLAETYLKNGTISDVSIL